MTIGDTIRRSYKKHEQLAIALISSFMIYLLLDRLAEKDVN